jgi:uncharacterized linocin/CFP29 family protein
MDFIGRNGAQGEVATYLASNGALNVNAMKPYIGKDGRTYMTVFKGGDKNKVENYKAVPIQANGVLRRDEWKTLDEAVLKISDDRIPGVAALRQRGLVYNIGNGMGSTVFEYHDMSDAMEADLTMDGITKTDNDRVVYTTNYLPLPILHSDYQINARVLAASRNMGMPLDTTYAERATRKVLEKLEDMFFTATSYTYGGGTIYGYLNHPNRNEYTITAWDSSAKTAAQIKDDVLGMKQASIDAKHYGPWVLHIPTSYETVLDDDFDTQTPGTTIRERLLKISGIEDIIVVDHLTDDNVVLVEMRPETVRLVTGMGIQNVQWDSQGGMTTKYKVMTIQVPQIRADQDGNSGIVHGSTA